MLHLYKGTNISPSVSEEAIDALETFEFRDDDILLATYPKSGTHWMNEVLQLILHDGDASRLGHAHRRFPLELKDGIYVGKMGMIKPSIELIAGDPPPRVLISHLRPHHFPKVTWSKRIPIVYVMRDPRDVCLSMFEFICTFILPNGQPYWSVADFDKYLVDFTTGQVIFDGWWKHVISYEELEKRNENILIVTYEEMKKDISSVVRRLAKHIKHDITEDIVAKVAENSTMEAMRKNYKRTEEERKEDKDLMSTDPVPLTNFVKIGLVGRWNKEYPEEKWRPLLERFREETKDTIHAKQYFQ